MFKLAASKANSGGDDVSNHLSPDWEPQPSSNAKSGPTSGGGAKSLFMRGKNAIKLQPQKKSALSIIREARSGGAASPDTSLSLASSRGPSYSSPLMVVAQLDPIDLDDGDDSDDMGVTALPTVTITNSDKKDVQIKGRRGLYESTIPSAKSSTMLRKSDARFKEIKRELARRARNRKTDTDGVQEYYVDSHRMISVNLSSEESGDLKTVMAKSGLKGFGQAYDVPGLPNDILYVKYAENYLKKYQYEKALVCINQALEMNRYSLAATLAKARCHLLLGNWKTAIRAAEEVLLVDPMNMRGLLVKAESLFNLCFFEHALVLFHRGKALYPESEEFRLGIQKCKETIEVGVQQSDIFLGGGVEAMFQVMRRIAEMRSVDKIGSSILFGGEGSRPKMSLASLSSVLKAKEAREEQEAKVEERTEDSTDEIKPLDPLGINNSQTKASDISPVELNLTTVPCSSDILATGGREGDDDQGGGLAHSRKSIKYGGGGGGSSSAHMRIRRDEPRLKKGANFQTVFKEFSAASVDTKKLTINLSADRMLEDKVYLSMLAESITKVGILTPEDEGGCGTNGIDTEVRAAASDALNFLRSREDFWEQVDVGKEQQQDASSRTTRRKKPRKVLQSTRLHYIM